MGKRNSRRNQINREGSVEPNGEPGESRISSNALGVDPARALLAVHSEEYLAVSCGSSVQMFNARAKEEVHPPEAKQSLPIRALSFDLLGAYFLTAGDDKLVRVWKCSSWTMYHKVVASKKISSASFTTDGNYVVFADKFGDVLVSALHRDSEENGCEVAIHKPHLLLGHFSSIVSCLLASPDNRWLVSGDREGKVRVSQLPSNPELGAHCIQSFCLGHTAFVTCAAFLGNTHTPSNPFLVTGSGDGSIRLWDPATGAQLDCFDSTPHTQYSRLGSTDLGTEATCRGDASEIAPDRDSSAAELCEQLHVQKEGMRVASSSSFDDEQQAELKWSSKDNLDESCNAAKMTAKDCNKATAKGMLLDQLEGGNPSQVYGKQLIEMPPAVLALAPYNERNVLAAAIEGENALLILSTKDRKLSLIEKRGVPGVSLPNSLAFDGVGRLHVAGGCQGHLRLMVGTCAVPNVTRPEAATAESHIHWIRPVLAASSGGKVEASTSQSFVNRGLQVSLELRKWVYSEEEIAKRKRNRADLRDQDNSDEG